MSPSQVSWRRKTPTLIPAINNPQAAGKLGIPALGTARGLGVYRGNSWRVPGWIGGLSRVAIPKKWLFSLFFPSPAAGRGRSMDLTCWK